MAQIEVERKLNLNTMELQTQAHSSTSQHQCCNISTPRIKDAKSPKLPSFIDEKDELDSYLLRFECYTENASREKNTWAIKLSALLTGRAMDVYTRMSDTDANDYDKLKKALLIRYNYTEDSCRKRFRQVKPETEETPDQFVIRLPFEELPSQVVRTFWKQFWRPRSPSGSDSQGTVYQCLF